MRLRASRRRAAALEARLAECRNMLADAREEVLAERERAESAGRAKSAFLANMSHELRTPLNAIIGFAQLMARNPALGSEDQEHLTAILRGGGHLLGLVNDVLSLSRLETGTLSALVHTFDPRQLLHQVEDIIRVRAEGRGIRFDVFADESLPAFVLGDEDKLRQVLLHLLGNTIEFSEAREIALRARWSDGSATFEIEDTGTGIAPAEMGVLFEAFVQAQSGLHSLQGAGLGLALSRNLVLMMDGDIFAISEPGKGTVFTIQLPLPVTHEAAGRVVGIAPGERAYRVLVVDDSPADRTLVARLLQAVGFDVREAENGSRAVKVWKEWGPDMVWMDTRMPVMGGYEATRRIRDDERMQDSAVHRSSVVGDPRLVRRSTKVVAVATEAFEHEREEAIENGADAFVVKPLAETAIFALMADLLGVRYAYDEVVPAGTNRVGEDVAIRARLAAVPRDVIGELNRALTIGDDRMAREIVERIAPQDAPLAGELNRLLRQFRFDEIAHLIESIPVKAGSSDVE